MASGKKRFFRKFYIYGEKWGNPQLGVKKCKNEKAQINMYKSQYIIRQQSISCILVDIDVLKTIQVSADLCYVLRGQKGDF